jgi:hypothetical protein
MGSFIGILEENKHEVQPHVFFPFVIPMCPMPHPNTCVYLSYILGSYRISIACVLQSYVFPISMFGNPTFQIGT